MVCREEFRQFLVVHFLDRAKERGDLREYPNGFLAASVIRYLQRQGQSWIPQYLIEYAKRCPPDYDFYVNQESLDTVTALALMVGCEPLDFKYKSSDDAAECWEKPIERAKSSLEAAYDSGTIRETGTNSVDWPIQTRAFVKWQWLDQTPPTSVGGQIS